MLLTGNLASTSRLKLEHHGLWRFFTAGGAFSSEGLDRPGIARQARALAAQHAGEEPSGEQMVVIGDTPHDVACGKAIGAPTVAVASGSSYTLPELEAVEPWRAVSQLPDPALLPSLLGLAPAGR
jgi:phosphoglycolate phosphatase